MNILQQTKLADLLRLGYAIKIQTKSRYRDSFVWSIDLDPISGSYKYNSEVYRGRSLSGIPSIDATVYKCKLIDNWQSI